MNFPMGYGYYYTQEDTQKKVLGSFNPNLMTKFKVIEKNLQKWQFEPKSLIFDPPPGYLKGVKMNFLEKKQKRHALTFPKTKLHAKNQKILSRGFPGKQGETDRETDRQIETDPNSRVLWTLSLSRRTKNMYNMTIITIPQNRKNVPKT